MNQKFKQDTVINNKNNSKKIKKKQKKKVSHGLQNKWRKMGIKKIYLKNFQKKI